VSEAPRLDALPEVLRRAWVPAPADEATEAWLHGPGARPHGPILTGLQRLLRRFASDFEVNARLGMYSLHLAGTDTFAALLDRAVGTRGGLLDVGAGTGEVTAALAPLFDRVVATETSPAMARRIRARLPDALTELVDLTHGPPLGRFEVVALLNVLDRTARPRTLLDRALAHLEERGVLLVATPLPARPHVDVGGATADPDEELGGDGDTFEEALANLHRTLLAPRGLRVRRWTRLPYRSQGDREAERYEHDDAVLVLERISE
jgi:SAM-dependent methyltransferase